MLSEEEQRLDSVVDLFEDEWDPKLFDNIAAWIQQHASDLGPEFQEQLISELVKVDLELCWRRSSIQSKIERYQQHLPELSVELLLEEYCVRHRWGDAPGVQEYVERFGELGQRLASQLEPTNDYRSPSATEFTPSLPDRIGRFQVLREIGRGGFGLVCLARDEVLNRHVAIKIVRGTVTNEATTSASLSHPAFVRVFDMIQFDASTCIVMEYVNGCTLSDWIGSPEYTLTKGLQLVAEIAEALEVAHKSGLIHCDIKPSNILIDENSRPKITDFGLAIRQEFQREAERSNICGTPLYMSPEQVRGELKWLDGRTDIWAVGVLLYQLITGVHPFKADTTDIIFDRILYSEPARPSSIVPSTSREVEEICLRCLCKRLSDRWSSAAEIANALRAAVDQHNGTLTSNPKNGRHVDLDLSLPAEQPIVGREVEIKKCSLILQEERTKLLTLHGPGGIGKTTLASAVARRLQSFDSVLFLDLSAQKNSQSLRMMMATKLRIECHEDVDFAVLTAIRAKGRTLVILDNFEQLVPAGLSVVKDWLGQLVDCTFLVTSRIRLGIPQEMIVAVGPLALASADANKCHATQLFTTVASRIEPEFSIQGNEATIQQICERLDCIPLGIELAATRIAILEPQQILDRLKARETVGSSESGTSRHRTLRDAVHWSVSLLSEHDRTALLVLALLPAGCFVSDAEAVVAAVAEQSLDKIQRLRDHSLVRLLPTEFGKRLALYQPVRDTLLEEFVEETERLWTPLARTFLARCTTHLNAIANQPELSATQKLFLERDNLIAIHDWAMRNQQQAFVCSAIRCLEPTLRLRGLYRELAAMLRPWDAVIPDGVDPDLTAQVLLVSARNSLDLGDAEQASSKVCEALSLANDPDLQIEGKILLSEVETTSGNLAAAEPRLMSVYEELSLTKDHRFSVCLLLAQIRRRTGQFESAQALLDQAKAIANEHKNDHMLAAVTLRQGNLAISQGNCTRAIQLLTESEQSSVRNSNRRAQHLALTSRGVAYCELREFDRAIQCFDAAQEIATELGEIRAIAVNEGNRGIALAETRDFVGAIHAYLRAEALNDKLNRNVAMALNQSNRAVAVAALGDLNEALELIGLGHETLTKSADRLHTATVSIDFGIMLHLAGNEIKAIEQLERAFREIDGGIIPHATELAGRIALAEALMEVQNNSDAMGHVKIAIAKSDNHWPEHILMGSLGERIRNLEKKIQEN